mmetsp:Transcript_4880/g.7325  ORF Transcript_4880/g.7325 Transcript_4880/m.7325 type:complete len:149 (-) Transcript_4880:37-483(-)
MIDGYVGRRQATKDSQMKEAVCDYVYHLLMRKSSSECSIMVLFSNGLQAHLPLGTPEKLANPDFSLPVSFVMGSEDWVRFCDEDYGEVVIGSRPSNSDSSIPYHEKGHYHFCPNSGHNLHQDNPNGFGNIIIKDLLGEDASGQADYEE